MKTYLMIASAAFMLTAVNVPASAGTVDVIQAPTGYFVPDDASKYNSPYYRDENQDWGWTHNPIVGPITSATLQISAFDVDYGSSPSDEHDKVYAYDNGVKTLIGELIGQNDAWAYTDFVLGANFFDDIAAGLQIFIDIDSNNTGDWLVTLAKSVLSIDGGAAPPPAPGETPLPGALPLLASGLGGFGLLTWRRKRKAKAIA